MVFKHSHPSDYVNYKLVNLTILAIGALNNFLDQQAEVWNFISDVERSSGEEIVDLIVRVLNLVIKAWTLCL
jgi:hypothetical protein